MHILLFTREFAESTRTISF